MGVLGAILKSKKVAGAIKSVKPFSNTGAKSVSKWKSAAAKAKLGAAKFNLKETFKKSDKALDKLKKTEPSLNIKDIILK